MVQEKQFAASSSLDLDDPPTHEFPTQKIDGISPGKLRKIGLRSFEPFPDGDTFVDAGLGGGTYCMHGSFWFEILRLEICRP
jgi:hypothetical protein